MKTTPRIFAAAGAWLGLAAVAAGAFGAHALKPRVDAAHLSAFETAVRYQLMHALALIAVDLLRDRAPERALRWAGALFIAGIALFSGSLYVLATSRLTFLGFVTPLGGLALMGGWLILALALSNRAGRGFVNSSGSPKI